MRFLLVLGDDDNTYQIRFESRPRRAAIACGFTVCRCEADSERRHIDWAAAPVPQRAGHRTTRRRGRRARSRSWLPRSGPASARRGAALPVPLGAPTARALARAARLGSEVAAAVGERRGSRLASADAAFERQMHPDSRWQQPSPSDCGSNRHHDTPARGHQRGAH